MKTNEHLVGDRVSVRCRLSSLSTSQAGKRRSLPAGVVGIASAHPRSEAKDLSWLGGRITAREATRYVVQLDDNRLIVAAAADVRRWSLSFELVEALEKIAS